RHSNTNRHIGRAEAVKTIYCYFGILVADDFLGLKGKVIEIDHRTFISCNGKVRVQAEQRITLCCYHINCYLLPVACEGNTNPRTLRVTRCTHGEIGSSVRRSFNPGSVGINITTLYWNTFATETGVSDFYRPSVDT